MKCTECKCETGYPLEAMCPECMKRFWDLDRQKAIEDRKRAKSQRLYEESLKQVEHDREVQRLYEVQLIQKMERRQQRRKVVLLLFAAALVIFIGVCCFKYSMKPVSGTSSTTSLPGLSTQHQAPSTLP